MKKITLWHGTATGENHESLTSVFNGGLLPARANMDRNGQKPGVYFSPRKTTAEIYARTATRHHGGDPLIVKVDAELDARHWDIDHEMTAASMDILADFKSRLEEVRPGEINIAFSNWGGGREEKVSSIHCTQDHLVIAVDRVNAVSPGKSGSFEIKIPWTGEFNAEEMLVEEEALSGASMTTRLQALHDYLRNILESQYTDRLQKTLEEAGEKKIHVKYVGAEKLVPAEYLGQLADLGGSAYSDFFVKIDPAKPHREQVLDGLRQSPPGSHRPVLK
jgi:hypothetical protein